LYPVCLNITDSLCVVVGGGTVAERKVLGLLAAEARVIIISPQLTPPLQQLAEDERVEWVMRPFKKGDLQGAQLVFAATDNKQVQDEILQEAELAGQLVNVIDVPKSCSFQVPAVVRRGNLTLTVSTDGKSPAVSAMVRRELEKSFGHEYDQLLNLMARLRQQVLVSGLTISERKTVFKKILHKDIVQWIVEEKWDLLRKHLCDVLGKDVDFDISQLGRDS
jgi:precorrin-2 dehydrogenase/sirohydrochlorin ferrochelatase